MVEKTVSIKILSCIIVFYFDENNKKCFISILEGFLKDHVTLKTGVMIKKNKNSLQ